MIKDIDFKVEKVLGFSVRVLCDDGVERNVEFSDFIAQRNENLSTNSYKKYYTAYGKNTLLDCPFGCLSVPDTYDINFNIECDGYLIKVTALE